MASYFAWIVDFVGRHPHYALTAIFLLALSEAVPVVGTVVPGSTLIIGICALATGAHVNPWPLLGAAIVGAIFGDGLSFWLGHRYHRELLLRWPLNRYPQFIARSEAFIRTYGAARLFYTVLKSAWPRCGYAGEMRPLGTGGAVKRLS
jgi:membrane protein DedA with SNARE-associated domain